MYDKFCVKKKKWGGLKVDVGALGGLHLGHSFFLSLKGLAL